MKTGRDRFSFLAPLVVIAASIRKDCKVVEENLALDLRNSFGVVVIPKRVVVAKDCPNVRGGHKRPVHDSSALSRQEVA